MIIMRLTNFVRQMGSIESVFSIGLASRINRTALIPLTGMADGLSEVLCASAFKFDCS